MLYLHLYSFLATYMDIDPERIFSQVLCIREQLEKWERDFFCRNLDLVRLPAAPTVAEQEVLSEWG